MFNIGHLKNRSYFDVVPLDADAAAPYADLKTTIEAAGE
jgi:hypothetical protein